MKSRKFKTASNNICIMNSKTLKFTLILIFIYLFSAKISYGQDETDFTLDWARTTAGQVRTAIMNLLDIRGSRSYPYLGNTIFPPGSGIEFNGHSIVMIGGITAEGDTLVNYGDHHAGNTNFHATAAPWDTVWQVRRGDTVDIGGQTDEGENDIYWPNYVPVSAEDFIYRCNDYRLDPGLASGNIPHEPMYLDVTTTVFSWSQAPLDRVIFYTFYIVPQKTRISSMFFTLQYGGRVGPVNLSPQLDDMSKWFDDEKLLTYEDRLGGPDGSETTGAVGIRVFPPDDMSEEELEWSYQWQVPDSWFDGTVYEWMSAGRIMQNQTGSFEGKSYVSVGPFNANVGDTVKVQFAQILSADGVDGVHETTEQVVSVRAKDFEFPTPPPNPPLQVETQSKKVILNWEPTEEKNPETYTDPNRVDSVEQPFEGYRVYKSTQSADGPWTLLADYDIAGNTYGPNQGLTHQYIDEGLLNNVSYYYAITAYSKPDKEFPWPEAETGITQYAQEVTPGPAAPDEVGEVAVVPNPYRGDISYQEYNPPWESSPPSRPWMEQDRRLQFINLPPRCKIVIYNAAGERVNTLKHNNPNKGYIDWNMTSYVNQAIASGLYFFTVENLETGNSQVGKFVVIK